MPFSAAARLLESDDDKRAWHAISESPVAGQMHQCYWWADPLKKAGVRAKGIGIWKGAQLVGGGLFRSIPVPYVGAHMTQCLAGPLHLDWHSEWADHFVSRIDELARADNSIEVAIHGCASRDAHRDITSAFLRRGLKLASAPGVTEAVLSLAGAAPEKIWSGMNEGTRRNIKKARKHALQVRELRSTPELRAAHDAWLATARRKGFSDVRPWDLLEPVLRHCIDNGMGAVYATYLDEKLLAAIFVTFIGGHASYVYGGYVDGGEEYSPNHLLHQEAIARCLEKGMKSYNFGKLLPEFAEAPAGTDRFKLGFGALPVRKADSIIWKRKPLLAGGIEWLRARAAGKALAEKLKSRLLSKQEEARES